MVFTPDEFGAFIAAQTEKWGLPMRARWETELPGWACRSPSMCGSRDVRLIFTGREKRKPFVVQSRGRGDGKRA